MPPANAADRTVEPTDRSLRECLHVERAVDPDRDPVLAIVVPDARHFELKREESPSW